MAQVEAAIDELLTQRPAPCTATLTQIEDVVLKASQAFQERLTTALLAESSAVVGPQPVACPTSGGPAQAKGKRRRRVVTRTGEVSVRREYYYCRACRAGFFPLDKQWAMERSVYSPERVKQMAWLAAQVPYATAAEIFQRIGGVTVPPTSLWEQTQTIGQAWQIQQAQAQSQLSLERVVLPPAGQDHTQPKGVSLDGGTVNVRGEGWKEIKVGAVGELSTTAAPDPVTHETVEVGCVQSVHYCGVVGSVTQFAPALWALAVQHDIPTAAEVVVTADGAEWIWNLTADYFPDSIQIVDWYHATQHLAQAATALHPTDPVTAQTWAHMRREALYLGQVEQITQPLEQAALPEHARYFHTHTRRMQYQEFREQHYPIGSGTVESGIKQFKHRLTGPGMRWSRPGLERMVLLRAAVLSHTFDDAWTAALN
jgi:hypothetical protein